MPQLPTSTPAEDDGAQDEIMRFHQEEDECSDTSTVDVVNDIKDDLLNEDGPDSGKTQDEHHLYRNHNDATRYTKDTNHGGMYGSPAAVIVGPHRYYEHPHYRSGSNHAPHAHPNSFSSGTQIRMPMYPRDDRPYYDHGPWPPSQVAMPPHYASMHYGGNIPRNFRYPSGMPVQYYGPGHGYGMPGRPVKEQKRPHVKKPLNAFMLFMKEQRPKIAAEFTLKESAAINQILGKRWHALDKSEQAKYYEMARKERAIHMQLYPGWSARDNYAQLGRKKKRPRDKNEEMNPKKCRARYGLDRQEQWCKPCRRKKKCIRFLVGADGETTEVQDKEQDEHSDSDDNTENKVQNPDSKENLQELVTMMSKDSNAISTNNNNISSDSNEENNTNSSVPSRPISCTSTQSTSNSLINNNTAYSSTVEVISSSISLSLSAPSSAQLTPQVTYSSNGHSLNNILTNKTLDSGHVKRISAPCS